MTDSKLEPTLRSLVQEHGMGKVLKTLGEIDDTRHGRHRRLATSRNGAEKKVGRRKPRLMAPEYVKKMDLPAEKSVVLAELAKRFQQKDFLPNFAAIAEFCRTYEIKAPASNSRASAIPRVFKAIAGMEVAEVERILDDGMFAGPSSLGPIADAIRNFSRAPAL